MKSGTDWDSVKARLALANEGLERALQPSPEKIANAYRERAIRLAMVPSSRPAASIERVIVFRIGGERYSIGLEHLSEVIPLHDVTPVPGVPKHIAGVIGIRGEIRPLMDLRTLLGIETDAGQDPGYGLLLNKPAPGLGLQVDLVEGVGLFAHEDSQPVDISRYATCRSANAGTLLSVDALLGALEGRL
jgi:purine-binding chemotaxis protein CheW